MICPTTTDEWRAIVDRFYEKWNFPHTCGALDGKHVACRCPPKTGSMYYNYKGFYSVVLMALVDADYKFIWADVGGTGSASDAQIYNDSELRECAEDGTLGFPDPEHIPNDYQDVPYYFIGDDAFALRPTMMKPYSHRGLTNDERVFNYRLSRARRVVENSFGILANRFQQLDRAEDMNREFIPGACPSCQSSCSPSSSYSRGQEELKNELLILH